MVEQGVSETISAGNAMRRMLQSPKAWSPMLLPSLVMVSALLWPLHGRAGAGTDTRGPVLAVAEGLFDDTRPDTLGLAPASGTETFTVFSPGPGDDAYAHGVVLMPFKGRLYAQWQSSRRDEDGPDTHVVFAVSDDGRHWSEPMPLAPTLETGIRTSGGWWTDGETLVAYLNEWPERDGAPKGGHTVFRSTTDGVAWSDLRPVLDIEGSPVQGVIEQDTRALPSGRLLSAFHVQPGLIVSPWFTDDPLGVRGWAPGHFENLPSSDTAVSRELEPSWFLRPGDGAVVMIFRDQAGSYRKLASVSRNLGESWSSPALTTIPDARTKQSAGNLPDGRAFMVGNPVPRRDRFPLVLMLSDDGRCFGQAWLLRGGGDDMQPLRFEGRYKRAGYSYPKSVVRDDALYVAYATNKEDVQITRVPLTGLRPGDHSTACR